MDNPATQLAALFKSWTVKSNTRPEVSRGMMDGQPNNLQFWRDQSRAVQLLREVEKVLASMKDAGRNVSHHEALLPKWYQAVFAYSTPWQSQSGSVRTVLPPDTLAALQGLGDTIDFFAPHAHLSEDEQTELSDLLSDVAGIVGDDKTIPEAERRYIWGLIKEAQRCLDETAAFGTATLRGTVNELSGAIMKEAARSAEAGDGKKSGRLINMGLHLANTFGTAVMAEGAQIAIEAGKNSVGM